MTVLNIRDNEDGFSIPVTLGDTGEVVTIDVEHQAAHDGRAYLSSYVDPVVGAGADIDVLVTLAPEGGVPHHKHGYFRAAAGGDARLYLYEGVVCSGGTPLSLVNRNRQSSNTLDVDLFVNPSCTASGTLLAETLSPGGSRGANTTGASTREQIGWVLKHDTDYLFRVVNIATAAQPISLGISIVYEEEK